MRIIALLFLALSITAADQPRQLDPSKPDDALQIIDIITKDETMTRANAIAVTVALQTLAKVVQEQAKATTSPVADATKGVITTKPKE